MYYRKNVKSYISFRLNEGESWNVDEVIADLKILVVQLMLVSHDYWETERQFHAIISITSKKSRGNEISPDVLENLISQINEREASLGICKAIQIIIGNSVCSGTVNERGGLKLIGNYSLKDSWAQKITDYLKHLSGKGELKLKEERVKKKT